MDTNQSDGDQHSVGIEAIEIETQPDEKAQTME